MYKRLLWQLRQMLVIKSWAKVDWRTCYLHGVCPFSLRRLWDIKRLRMTDRGSGCKSDKMLDRQVRWQTEKYRHTGKKAHFKNLILAIPNYLNLQKHSGKTRWWTAFWKYSTPVWMRKNNYHHDHLWIIFNCMNQNSSEFCQVVIIKKFFRITFIFSFWMKHLFHFPLISFNKKCDQA